MTNFLVPLPARLATHMGAYPEIVSGTEEFVWDKIIEHIRDRLADALAIHYNMNPYWIRGSNE